MSRHKISPYVCFLLYTCKEPFRPKHINTAHMHYVNNIKSFFYFNSNNTLIYHGQPPPFQPTFFVFALHTSSLHDNMNLPTLARTASRATRYTRSPPPCIDQSIYSRVTLENRRPEACAPAHAPGRQFSTMLDHQPQPLPSNTHIDQLSPQQVLSDILALPKWSPDATLRPVNRLQMSEKQLFHRSVVAHLRQPGSRMVKQIRKKAW